MKKAALGLLLIVLALVIIVPGAVSGHGILWRTVRPEGEIIVAKAGELTEIRLRAGSRQYTLGFPRLNLQKHHIKMNKSGLLAEMVLTAAINGSDKDTLTATVRILPGGDFMLFLEGCFAEPKAEQLFHYRLELVGAELDEIYLWPQSREGDFQRVAAQAGEIPTYLAPLLLNYRDEAGEPSVVLGPLQNYNDLGYGIRQHVATPSVLDVRQEGDIALLVQEKRNSEKNHRICQWFVLSGKRLLDVNDPVVREVVAGSYYGQPRGLNYLTAAGSYRESSALYLPYAEGAVFLNYQATAVHNFLDAYKLSGSPFLADVVLNNAHALLAGQGRDGSWRTKPFCTWLEKYGIGADFFDTRLNTDAALFLLAVGKEFDLPKAVAGAGRLVKMYKKMVDAGHVFTTPNGFMLCDYWQEEQDIKSHASLNHVINELYYLIWLYELTGREDLLDLIEPMLHSIEDLNYDWVGPDGDFYYAIYNGDRIADRDYKVVTYRDLRILQSMLSRVFRQEYPLLAGMAAAKTAYLKSIDWQARDLVKDDPAIFANLPAYDTERMAAYLLTIKGRPVYTAGFCFYGLDNSLYFKGAKALQLPDGRPVELDPAKSYSYIELQGVCLVADYLIANATLLPGNTLSLETPCPGGGMLTVYGLEPETEYKVRVGAEERTLLSDQSGIIEY